VVKVLKRQDAIQGQAALSSQMLAFVFSKIRKYAKNPVLTSRETHYVSDTKAYTANSTDRMQTAASAF
jgi:hypothetical protein